MIVILWWLFFIFNPTLGLLGVLYILGLILITYTGFLSPVPFND